MNAPNVELAYKVLDHIDAHPETWDQAVWNCGTVACFAGWAVRLSGETAADDPDSADYTPHKAARLLGFPDREEMDAITDEAGEVGWLFASDNTREDLGRMVAEIFGPRPKAIAAAFKPGTGKAVTR